MVWTVDKRPLTPRQTLALAFIREHSICSITEIEAYLSTIESEPLQHGASKWGLVGLRERGLIIQHEVWSDLFGGRYVYRYTDSHSVGGLSRSV